MRGRFRAIIAAVLVGGALAVSAHALEDVLGRPIPPLELPRGRVVRVSKSSELKPALESAREGDVILIADGEYKVGRLMFMRGRRNITVCGESKDPTKVIIRGKGWTPVNHGDDILRIGDCEKITIAHVTFTDCHAYALKVQAESFPKDINIYNCHFRDIATRGIKGSSSPEGRALKGSVRYCHFENTKIPPRSWQFGGNYITGIDMMALDGWTFADNVFKNIKGATGGARGAIFIWVRSRNLVVERNVMIDCNRGIAFGNPSGSTARTKNMLHITNAVCRNNFIKTGPDAGIELAWVENVKVYNNSIWRKDLGGRGIRCIQKIGKVDIVNNLVRGRIALSGGATETNNIVGPLDGYFEDIAKGDMRLARGAAKAINAAKPLDDVKDDFFGHARDNRPDLGAMEFGAKPKTTASAKPEGPPGAPAKPVRPGDRLAEHRGAMASAAKLAAAGDAHGAAAAYRKLAVAAGAGELRTAFEMLAAGASRDGLVRMIVAGVKKSGPKRVYVDVAGRNQRAKLMAADGEKATITVSGSTMPVAWTAISPKRVGGIASKYAASAADHLAVAKYLAACGLTESARQALDRAHEARPSGDAVAEAKALGEVLK